MAVRPQVSGKEAKCVCNNSCRLEGRQLTAHIAEMERNGPVLAGAFPPCRASHAPHNA